MSNPKTETMNAIYNAGKIKICDAKFINIRKAGHYHQLYAVATHNVYGNKLTTNVNVILSIEGNTMTVYKWGWDQSAFLTIVLEPY